MNQRDRRALRWGAATVLGAVLLLRAVPWAFRGIAALQEREQEKVETASRARTIVAHARAIEDSLARTLSGIVALAPRLVEGRSSGEAAASISGLVTLVANEHNLRLLRVDPLPDSELGVFRRVSVHAELEGDASGLASGLRKIERGEPLLTINSLVVSSPDPFGRVAVSEVLHIEMEVSGYYLPRGAQ